MSISESSRTHNPMITVIVPVYNCETYLERCVNSILSQTYKNIEIILVDDGSMDHSWDIITKLKNKYDKIRVFHQRNKGQAAARNFGVKQANGEYIAFVDADDWIESNMYEVLLSNIEKEGAQISCCGIQKDRDEKKIELYNDNINKYIVFNTAECISALFNNSIITSSPCDKLFKSSIIRKNPMTEGMYFEDYEIMPRWISEADKIVYTGLPLYHYCYNSQSTIQKVTIRRLDEVIASEKRTDFIVNNFPQFSDIAMRKDLENSINVLGYTCYAFLHIYRQIF